jgi:ADP-heptose:LPS heptosyltransferase
MEGMIVVLLHHGLGDVMMSRKLLLNLRSVFLDFQIILVVKSSVEKEFIEFLALDGNFKLIVLGYNGSYLSKAKSVMKLASLRWQNVKVLFAVHSTNGFFGNVLSNLIGARTSIGPEGGKGYTRTVELGSLHKIDYYLEFLSTYLSGIVNSSDQIMNMLEPVVFNNNYLHYFPKKYINIFNYEYVIIVPGTSPLDTHKRWPVVNFVSLVSKLLVETSKNIVLLGTRADSDVLNSVGHVYLENSRVTRVDDLSIRDALFLISRSEVLISACTSALHMGDLVGIRMVSIYGPTNYSFTGPTSKQNRILRLGYSCSPCFREQFTKGCNLPRCMVDITVNRVMIEINKTLNNEDVPSYPRLITTNSKVFKK